MSDTILHVVMSCIAAFFLYQMFVSDWLEDKLARWRDSRTTGKDRKSTRLNSSHSAKSRMPSSA